jgi:hypothetical protein
MQAIKLEEPNFEKEDGEEYAFGEEAPVGIFTDFSIRVGDPSEVKV